MWFLKNLNGPKTLMAGKMTIIISDRDFDSSRSVRLLRSQQKFTKTILDCLSQIVLRKIFFLVLLIFMIGRPAWSQNTLDNISDFMREAFPDVVAVPSDVTAVPMVSKMLLPPRQEQYNVESRHRYIPPLTWQPALKRVLQRPTGPPEQFSAPEGDSRSEENLKLPQINRDSARLSATDRWGDTVDEMIYLRPPSPSRDALQTIDPNDYALNSDETRLPRSEQPSQAGKQKKDRFPSAIPPITKSDPHVKAKKPEKSSKAQKVKQRIQDREFDDWDQALEESRSISFTDDDGAKHDGQQTKSGNFKGVIDYKDGGRYEGETVDGKRQGQGKMIYPSGGQYIGEWKEDQWHGQGTGIAANGNRYEGFYHKGRKHGKGIYVWSNGNRFEGYFENGVPSGQGVKLFANGDRYEGNWKSGLRHGQGEMNYSNGDRYNGGWHQDKYSRTGQYNWADGHEYKGDWEKGQRHGEGVFSFADGRRYEGEWNFDYRHGRGTETAKDGTLWRGFWYYDEPRGRREVRQSEAKNNKKIR